MTFSTKFWKRLLFSFTLSFLFLFNAKAQVSVTATSGTTTGNYTTVNEAFGKINDGTHKGDIVITVIGGTLEPATPTPLLKSSGTSSYTSVKIVPSGDAIIASATAPVANRGIIELAGADNVTIDGDDPLTPGDHNLTIQAATVTTAGVACIRLSSNSTTGTDGADNNTIKNCIIIGSRSSATTTTVSYGIQFSNGTAASSSSTGAYSSINTKIEKNIISKCYYGIYAYGNSATYYNTGTQILNNTIGNATSAADNVGLYGVYLSYTSAGATGAAVVSGNDIVCGDAATGFSANPAGVYVYTNANNVVITKNKIHDIGNGSTNGYGAYGISVNAAVTGTVITNNFIWDITGQNYSSGITTIYQNYGVFVGAAATGLVINHNTIRLTKPNLTTYGTLATPVSACIQITSATATVSQMYNNILVNSQNSTNAYGIITAAAANISGGTVNNNAYYSDYGKVGYYTTAKVTLADWKSATGKDLASISVMPDFVTSTDLHINPGGTPNQLESAGAAAAGITVDIDGEVRPGPAGSTNGGGTAPDIGADEFDGAPLDLTPPSISYTAITNNANTTTLALASFAAISDPSGVNVTTAKPRLYFKHASDANDYSGNTSATPGWKYVEATNTTSPFSFTIDYSLLPGGVVQGERIEYFVVAQDNATTPNVAINAGSFGAPPASVALTPGDFPVNGTLNAYFVTKIFSGTVNVGVGEAIESLTNAGGLFETLNNNILGGNLTVNVTTDLTAETGTIALNQLTEQGTGGYTVTIKPSGAPHEISGSSATNGALIRLNGADRIIFDGTLSGGTDRNFTIKNNATVATTVVIWITSASATNGANNNVFRNCNIVGTTGTNTTIAGILSGSGVTLGDDSQYPNNNNIILNNAFSSTQNGMYLRGNTTTLDSNWVVKGNSFGSTNTAEKHSFRGFLIGNAKNFLVDSNFVVGVQSAATSTSAMSGIQIALNVANGTVTRNIVRDIKQVSTTGYGAYGINISSATTTSNLNIYNNFVSDIAGNGSTTLANNGHGIYVNAGGGYNIYYNTVSLSTNQTASGGITAALLVTAGTGLNIKNNILSNTETVGNNYALYSSIAAASNAASFTSLDYNAYGTTGANLAYFSAAVKTDLAALQAAFATGNVHSKQVVPAFVSDPVDLHLASNPANIPLDDAATPIAGITTDIDNELRSATTPDIGADELPPVAGLDIKTVALLSPTVKIGCYGSDSIRVQIANNSTTTLNFATNPVTVNVAVSGATTGNYTTTLNTGTLASASSQIVTLANPFVMNATGTYTFYIELVLAGDVNTANNTLIVDRTKTVLTAGTVNATPDSYCITGGTPKLTATGMDGYAYMHWESSSTSATSGFTTIPGADTVVYTVTTPITQTMYYRAAFTCGSSTVYSDADSVVFQNPQVLTTTPNFTCGTGMVTLAATASTGATLNWYANSTGGTPIGTGNTFTTPSISSNTTYYVTAAAGAATLGVGPLSPTAHGGTIATGTVSWNVDFTVLLPVTLLSFDVYPITSGQSATILFKNITTSATVGTINYTSNVSGGTTPQTIPIGLFFTPGSYQITLTGTSIPSSGLTRNISGTTYPITSPGINITANGYDPTYYMYYYNWLYSSGCESGRTAVLATVNNDPGCTPTPVSLLSFTGAKENAVNVLSWTTAHEVNNAGFELQRSADGINFSKLAFVNSKGDNGNSGSQLTYGFKDERPFSVGVSYYRLKQVDKDGKSSFSNIVTIDRGRSNKLELVTLYPNPAKDKINLKLISPKTDKVTVIVTDVTGKVVTSNNTPVAGGENLLSINVQSLAKGSYFVKVVCADGCETAIQRFVKE